MVLHVIRRLDFFKHFLLGLGAFAQNFTCLLAKDQFSNSLLQYGHLGVSCTAGSILDMLAHNNHNIGHEILLFVHEQDLGCLVLGLVYLNRQFRCIADMTRNREQFCEFQTLG